MPEAPYSNRELDSKFNGLGDKIDELKDTVVDRLTDFETSASSALSEISAQTTKNNGRVTALEREVSAQDTANQVFRARIYTAITILVFILGSILVPIAAAWISTSSSPASTSQPLP
jgi:hypothetical protein